MGRVMLLARGTASQSAVACSRAGRRLKPAALRTARRRVRGSSRCRSIYGEVGSSAPVADIRSARSRQRARRDRRRRSGARRRSSAVRRRLARRPAQPRRDDGADRRAHRRGRRHRPRARQGGAARPTAASIRVVYAGGPMNAPLRRRRHHRAAGRRARSTPRRAPATSASPIDSVDVKTPRSTPRIVAGHVVDTCP